MEYLIKNKDEFSKIALGSATFGTSTPKATAFEVMEKYFSLGGNLIDTARAYCYWEENGQNASESTIGEFISAHGLKGKVYISTKGGHPTGKFNSPEFLPRLGASELQTDIDESLKYLKADVIDIYYLHRDDLTKPVEEIMPVLDKFVKEGKARYLGASNWTIERIEEANEFAVKNSLTPFSFSEIMWSYAEINKENLNDKSVLPMDEMQLKQYKKNGLTVMAFSSQAQGFYTRAKKLGFENLPENVKAVYGNDVNLKRIEKVNKISDITGISPTAIGLNYVINNKDLNAIAIIGGAKKEQIEDSFTALNLQKEYIDLL